MARRRRPPLRPILALALLAGAGYAAWRHGPALWQRVAHGDGNGVASATARDACALAGPATVADALGIGAVDAQATAPQAGVPAAGACSWEFAGIGAARGRATLLWFTRESLAAGGAEAGPGYFRSSVTGLEYAWKESPRPLEGVGDEAAIAGFGADSPRAGEVVVRRGDQVFDLVVEGADAAATRRLAAALAAGR